MPMSWVPDSVPSFNLLHRVLNPTTHVYHVFTRTITGKTLLVYAKVLVVDEAAYTL
jgi:hypothetical protein